MKEQEEEEKELEKQRLEQEEKEKKEQEEYEKWKEFLTLEESGTKLEEEKDEENLLEKFLTFIKLRKTTSIEDIAMRFDLSNKACVERINSLIESNMLKGVIDDRGKFLYIEDKEVDDLLKCIRKRGHFSRKDLIDAFSDIIRLEPTEEDSKKIKKEEEELLQGINTEFENMVAEEENTSKK
jgi:hypothetical protein